MAATGAATGTAAGGTPAGRGVRGGSIAPAGRGEALGGSIGEAPGVLGGSIGAEPGVLGGSIGEAPVAGRGEAPAGSARRAGSFWIG